MIPTTRAAAALLLAALLPAAAGADEVWTTAEGEAAWAATVDGTAVLAMPMGDGMLRLYIPDLDARMDSRGMHEAYWIGSGGGVCGATLTGPDGSGATNWGTGIVAFDAPAFPSGWTATLGFCAGPPSFSIRADAP